MNSNKLFVSIKLNFLAFIYGYILNYLYYYPLYFLFGIIIMHILVYYIVWSSVYTKKKLPEIKNQYDMKLLDIRYIFIWAIIEGIS